MQELSGIGSLPTHTEAQPIVVKPQIKQEAELKHVQLALKQPPNLLETLSDEVPAIISEAKAVELHSSKKTVFSPPPVEAVPDSLKAEFVLVAPDLEAQNLKAGYEESIMIEPVVEDPEKLDIAAVKAPGTDGSEIVPELTAEVIEAFYTHEATKEAIDGQAEHLPHAFERFIISVIGEARNQNELQEHIEQLVSLQSTEIDIEVVARVTESFIQTVAAIKETIDLGEEVAATQVEAIVVATRELLRTIAIEPRFEHIKQILVVAFGKEFVSRHLHIISDLFIDEIGTYERKLWPSKITVAKDQTEAHSTLLGKIALQWGFSLQLA